MVKNKTARQKIKSALVVYVPVLHQGYVELFNKYPEAEIVVVDKELLEGEFRSIQKDIRALETKQMVQIINNLWPEREVVHLMKPEQLRNYQTLIFPEDEISQWLESQLVESGEELETEVIHDSIFLRWSKNKTRNKNKIAPDEEVTSDELQQKIMEQLLEEKEKSGDWWRQVAAAVVKDGEMIALAYNQHKPSDQQQYVFGDARANYSSGVKIELSTTMHAEEAVIAAAARQGVSLEGADLYVTTFPCPFCARLVAYSGVKRLYYLDGYSLMDGAEVMRGQGVELVRVV